MTPEQVQALSSEPFGAPKSLHELAVNERSRYGTLFEDRREPYMALLGGLLCLVILVLALGAVTHAGHLPGLPGAAQARSEPALPREIPVMADRISCTEIGSSDLRSPAEGVWSQANCFPATGTPLQALSTDCNRTSVGDGFSPIAPDLFVSRVNPSAEGFLWYRRSDNCFDLVSTRTTTAVCGDKTVSFQWDVRAACASHGGIVALVNGR